MNIKIYTLDYCPYCKKAISFLEEKGVEFERIRIDDDEAGWYDKLSKKFGIEINDLTLPQIIIDDVRIGGYTDMMTFNEQKRLPF